MSHSAISATATMSLDVDMTLGTNSKNVDFAESLTSMRRTFDRTLYVPEDQFNKVMTIGTEDGDTLTDFDIIFIENLDGVNPVNVSFENIAGTSITFLIPAGKFFVLFSKLFDGREFIDGGACIVPVKEVASVYARFNTHEGVIRVLALEA